MYPPPHHQTEDQNEMLKVIKHYPLAMVVSVLNGRPLISHLPLIYNDSTGKITGHIDMNNPQVEALHDDKEVSLVFKGPDTYISPSIYTTEQLPTWNYMIVHLKGNVRAISNPEKAKRLLTEMTHYLEAPDHRYKLELDDTRMGLMINYIHAFEIEITSWEGKFKLSQDKCEQDQINANKQLIITNKERIVAFMTDLLK